MRSELYNFRESIVVASYADVLLARHAILPNKRREERS